MQGRALVVLAMLAAGWFLPGALLPLEWVDEGHLVYFSQRTAEGALPYRDFHHLYGPGTFLLNGGLLRLFGNDLLVVRLGIVATKTLLVVAAAAAASRGAGPAAGYMVWVLLVSVWGAPLWIFATPYASLYQATLDVVALAVLVREREPSWRRLVVVGCLLGTAALFKQTAGVLVGIGVAFFFLYRAAWGSDAVRDGAGRLPTAVRLAIIAGGVVVLAAYSQSFAGTRAIYVLLPPVIIFALGLAIRVVRRWDADWRDLAALGQVLAGALLPALLVLFVYAWLGSASGLIHDTLWGFPQVVSIVVPLPAFDVPTAMTVVVVMAACIAVELMRRGAARHASARPALWIAAAAVLVLAIAAVALAPRGGIGDVAAWHGNAVRLLCWVPVAVAWWAPLLLLTRPPASVAVAAFACVAVCLLPSLQPIADVPHLLLALPIFALLGVMLSARWVQRPLPMKGLAAATVWLLVLAVAFPFARLLVTDAATLLQPGPGYPHATGVRGSPADRDEQRALIAHLAAMPPETRVVVLPSAQMVQMLSGRRSPLDAEDFALYLGAFEEIPDDAVRASVDQPAAIAKLESGPVVVVRWPNPKADAAIRRILPELSAYVDAHFHEVARFGDYRVLARPPS